MSPEASSKGSARPAHPHPQRYGRSPARKSWGEGTKDGGAGLTHEPLLSELYDWAHDHLQDHAIVAVGHRVVHGGGRYWAPRLIDEALVAELDTFSPLAPLHQPHNLAAIREIARKAPIWCRSPVSTPASTMPCPASPRVPLPRAYAARGCAAMASTDCPTNMSRPVWPRSIRRWRKGG
jgi:hypothetical protein